ncbi:hypothetical protein PSTT_17120 [Puccinia striiformis]|uniref:Uncharacterized protein n=1 Tax=Puccinia striiformis TaxID=27350 RepID=A0A2S4U9G6_9BASI|nr:hypothetical protein PSTT_17120 [Puccinia striiformis]
MPSLHHPQLGPGAGNTETIKQPTHILASQRSYKEATIGHQSRSLPSSSSKTVVQSLQLFRSNIPISQKSDLPSLQTSDSQIHSPSQPEAISLSRSPVSLNHPFTEDWFGLTLISSPPRTAMNYNNYMDFNAGEASQRQGKPYQGIFFEETPVGGTPGNQAPLPMELPPVFLYLFALNCSYACQPAG